MALAKPGFALPETIRRTVIGHPFRRDLEPTVCLPKPRTPGTIDGTGFSVRRHRLGPKLWITEGIQ